MKPAPFRYRAARSEAEALDLLAEADAKVLAGGQSLMPMMNFRLVRPSLLVDVNRVPGLSGIAAGPGVLRLGAMTRHCETASDPLLARHFPILPAAMTHVAHVTVRNRGTFGGSIAHADPAAELPMLALLLDAGMVARGRTGTRRIPAGGFFVSALTTALRQDELLTAIELPFLPDGTGWGFEEFARRHGDYALASVAVLLRREKGTVRAVRIAAMGVGDTPLRLAAAERVLEGAAFGPDSLAAMVDALRGAITPGTDLNGSADYRRHLAGALARRAAQAAWDRTAP